MSESFPVLTIERYWAIEPEFAKGAFDTLANLDPASLASKSRRDSEESQAGERSYALIDGVAVLSLTGPLTKRPTWLSWLFGGTATMSLRTSLRQAATDPEVTAILLDVDSPGGTADGTVDLAEDVARLNQVKPIYGYVSDMACSAALWIVSQAEQVFANPTALIGSIGVYSVVADKSRLYENAGIKVHVISTGPLKGAGVSGAPVTKEALAEDQRIIDAIMDEFVAGVARGRRMDPSEIRAIADGRVLVGKEAVEAGLVDAIAPLETVLATIGSSSSIRSSSSSFKQTLAVTAEQGDHTMTKANLWQQLRSALGGSEGDEPTLASRFRAETEAAETPHASPATTSPASQAIMNPPAVPAGYSERMAALEAENAQLRNEAAFGRHALEELRRDAKAQAVRAYGASLGPQVGAAVDSLDATTVAAMRDTWRTEADAKYSLGPAGESARRISAPVSPARFALAADEEGAGEREGWNALSEVQKERARVMFPHRVKTGADRDALAHYILHPDADPKALSGFEE